MLLPTRRSQRRPANPNRSRGWIMVALLLTLGGRRAQAQRVIPDSAIVPDSAFDRFVDAAKWGMTRVRVTGPVWLQDGRPPAVTLSDPARLERAP